VRAFDAWRQSFQDGNVLAGCQHCSDSCYTKGRHDGVERARLHGAFPHSAIP
jgi:hypothetical protein